jgi:hypothetical protein
MGRPKGSKNKPKTPSAEQEPVKKAGKPVEVKVAPVPPPVTTEAPKRRGRPPGSKNKHEEGGVTTQPTAAISVHVQADQRQPAPSAAQQVDAPKRRGRPPGSKNVTKTEHGEPPPAAAVIVSRTESEEEQPPARAVSYTVDQLNDSALDKLEAHANEFFNLASPARKLMFENRGNGEITVGRAVLRTLVDFFEIDVIALIKHGK